MDFPAMHPEIFFNRRLIEVSTILKELDSYFLHVTLDEAERKLNKCNAQLEIMLDFARQHYIDLTVYQCDLREIEHRFKSIGKKIEEKKNAPRWKGVFAIFARAIGFVADLFGLGSVVKPLLGFKGSLPSLPPAR